MKKYHRTVVFTKVPLKSIFSYKDIFQIFPAELKNMPYYTGQNHFPNILEYWTIPEDNITIEHELEELKELYSDTAKILNKQDKILSLLSVVSNHLFFRYTDLGGNWAVPVLKEEPGEEANTWSSKWCLPQFWFPGLPQQLQIHEFSISNHKKTKLTRHIEYYTNNPNIDFDINREITFPETIELFLDSYFKLKPEIMNVLDKAILFAVSSMELRQNRKTLSILSSFTSVETMIDWEFREQENEKCEVCGQLKYSIARKFREYLLKYIGDSDENKKKFNRYYSLRSKITHTGHLLKHEILFSEVPKEERDKDYMTQLDILQLGKLAIVNWLITNNSSAAESLKR